MTVGIKRISSDESGPFGTIRHALYESRAWFEHRPPYLDPSDWSGHETWIFREAW